MKKYLLFIISIFISLLLMTKFYFFTFNLVYFPYIITPMGPDIFYANYRLTTIILGFVSIIITLIFVFLTKSSKKDSNNIKYGIISIVISIIFYISFYFIHLKYTYEEHPNLFGYISSDNLYIEDVYKYLNLVEKYGMTSSGYRPFKTLDDSIKALDFANQNNLKELYKKTFYDLERFGYDKVFENYQDITFQVYFLKELIEDYSADDILFVTSYYDDLIMYSGYITDKNLNNLYTIISNNFSSDSSNFSIEFLRGIYNKFINQLISTSGLNKDIFYY